MDGDGGPSRRDKRKAMWIEDPNHQGYHAQQSSSQQSSSQQQSAQQTVPSQPIQPVFQGQQGQQAFPGQHSYQAQGFSNPLQFFEALLDSTSNNRNIASGSSHAPSSGFAVNQMPVDHAANPQPYGPAPTTTYPIASGYLPVLPGLGYGGTSAYATNQPFSGHAISSGSIPRPMGNPSSGMVGGNPSFALPSPGYQATQGLPPSNVNRGFATDPQGFPHVGTSTTSFGQMSVNDQTNPGYAVNQYGFPTGAGSMYAPATGHAPVQQSSSFPTEQPTFTAATGFTNNHASGSGQITMSHTLPPNFLRNTGTGGVPFNAPHQTASNVAAPVHASMPGLSGSGFPTNNGPIPGPDSSTGSMGAANQSTGFPSGANPTAEAYKVTMSSHGRKSRNAGSRVDKGKGRATNPTPATFDPTNQSNIAEAMRQAVQAHGLRGSFPQSGTKASSQMFPQQRHEHSTSFGQGPNFSFAQPTSFAASSSFAPTASFAQSSSFATDLGYPPDHSFPHSQSGSTSAHNQPQSSFGFNRLSLANSNPAQQTSSNLDSAQGESAPYFLPTASTVFTRFLAEPDIMFEVCRWLPAKDLINFYATSKDFHKTANMQLSAMILGNAQTRMAESAQVFQFKVYKSLCSLDPNQVESKDKEGEIRDAPTLRWLSFLEFRHETVDSILRELALKGLRLPRMVSRVMKKIWFIMDIPDTKRRIGVIHNKKLWSDAELYVASMFFMKLDMACTDPMNGRGERRVRRLLMGQRSLAVTDMVLQRKEMTTQYRMLQMFCEWNLNRQRLFQGPPRQIPLTIYGVPWKSLSSLRCENWTQGGAFLMPPDELVMKEAVRRGLRFQDKLIDMMLWGNVHPVTGEDVWPKNWKGEIQIRYEDEVEDQVEKDIAIHASKKGTQFNWDNPKTREVPFASASNV